MRRLVPVLVLLLAPVLARADVVVLKNGTEFPGVIETESPAELTVLSEGTSWTFKRENVASVRREEASRDAELARNKARAEAAEAPFANAPRRRPIVVYGTSWCGYCRLARAYFSAHGLAFVDRDVERDPAAARDLERLKRSAGIRGNGVPVIDVRGTVVMGFDKRQVEAALAAKGG